MNKYFYNLIIVTILLGAFSGCSTKKYYEPEVTVNHDATINDTTSEIASISENGATLKNLKFISESGISEFKLENGFEFLNNVNGTILSSNNNGILNVNFNKSIKHYSFSKRVIAASIYHENIALLFIDNSIALYNTDEQRIVFKEYYTSSLLNNIKIANPVFLSSVVLIPTLDGKVIIVNFKTKQIIKTINIDPKSQINNIIYFKTIGDTLVAATQKKLFTFLNGSVKIKDLNIKDVVVTNSNIFVATLDGELIKFDHKLNKLLSKKFKFAKFYTLGYTTYLYALESQGYIVRLNDNFDEIKVFDFSFDENNDAIIIKDTLYFDDQYILLK